MLNFLLAVLFLFQAADPFVALEKLLTKNAPALAERDAAFVQLKAATKSGIGLTDAYARYQKAADILPKLWLDLRVELDRAKQAVGEKPDAKTKARLDQLSTRVDAFIKRPPDEDAVMKAYLEALRNSGPRPPEIRRPPQ